MAQQLPILLNSLFRASTLFLLGTGLSIIYGMLNFMNLAHAAFLALGAYVSASLIQGASNAIGGTLGTAAMFVVFLVILFVIVPGVISVVGLGMEQTIFKPLYGLEDDYQLLATFGVILMMEDSMKFIWGGLPVTSSAPSNMLGGFNLVGNTYPYWPIFAVVVTMVIATTLYYFFEETRLGKITLAMAEDEEVVSVTGIDTRSVHIKVYVIGVALAALGGALYLPNASITTGLSLEFVILAFAVLVIGGLGSLKGAIVASLLIGFMQSFGSYYVPQLSLAIVFLLMAAVMLIKPTGLFGDIKA
ncbi:branched-chain amino acid ABC transporter permease [Haladaptatus sp. QDMS2]|uniref:branched-chain amino acid ABC transporter permease n=1 Tax=Haladaptatus sp. QDMS2 TaxID=3033391 RepID=UPI0023E8E3E0|nr:branched-chain amino acid ABC transporter permease [Haladaptatus sp. QDMS2]